MREITKEIIIETKEEREALIERVDVLQKVKGLLLLPGLEMATTKQVADFYEVKLTTINNMILMHREELEADGVVFKKYLELEKEVNSQNFRELKIARRGVNVFPKRAILRVGMLLRDSEVAKEVRSQLLNIEEKAEEHTKVADAEHETKLINAVGIAAAECDVIAYGKALKELEAWKNRHIIQDAENYAALRDLKQSVTMTELCKKHLGGSISAQKANLILGGLGIYKADKMNGSWIPEKEYEEKGWFVLKTQPTRFERMEVTNYRLTEKGADEITKLLKQHLMREGTQAA
ncbi:MULTISPECIES: phage antirepressor KilAC domain-containing protein [unclassified Bacillus cereus group]|uniref:phage antirepressor KilAC domain-containing protein n=1 Tax=unclassified Bacillus cereus group TaxID=2750818 RepID=UPI001F565507|nr:MULTISPECIES: phage antirepressor KilAC domain-containing protein [unclassified Bacillus cereus group]MDA1593074.1 phage antirepressor KilAC domain-containing protein [Bacillus cereus group sp. TH225LC]